MIAKGNLHGDSAKLAAYLVTGKEGERAELVELRGFAADNIRDAFADVEIQAEATHATKPFFHAYVRLVEGEALDRAQWQHVADRIEARLGFADQPRAVAFHHLPDGATHMHVAWSRIDTEQMRAIDPGLYKNKLKEISRELERELGLTQVRNERDPDNRTLAPGRNEFEQARRLDTDLKAIRNTIRDCWEQSDSGRSFAAALDAQGLILARGDRRDFVVIDHAGGDHALSKRITGAPAAEMRARLADIDRARLPSVDQAKAMQEVDRSIVREAVLEIDRSLGIAPAAEPTPVREPDFNAAAAHIETAPAAVQTHERSAASFAAGQERPAPTASARDAGMRDAGDVSGGILGSVASALGKVLDFFADMISPPPLPTPEQAQRAEQAADEQAVTREAAEKEARFHELLDQITRDRRQRLEEQLRDDLGRERDDDYDRGRERER